MPQIGEAELVGRICRQQIDKQKLRHIPPALMGMILTLKFASDQEIRRLLTSPQDITDFLGEEGSATYLDKAWHGIHWLLTKSPDAGEEPLCYLLAGGEQIGKVDVGYGPARALDIQQVASWDAALSQISREELAGRFDPAAMSKVDLYPNIWDDEDALDYLLDYYGTLRDFVAAARKEGSGLLIYLS